MGWHTVCTGVRQSPETEEFWVGMCADAVSLLPCCPCDIAAKSRKLFSGDHLCSWGVGRSLRWNSTHFLSSIRQQIVAERAPFLPKAFRSEQLYFLLITCIWKTTVFWSFCPSWDILQQKHWGPLGKNCVQLQHNSVTWGKDLISTLCRSYVQWKLYKCSIPAHMSFPQNVTTILLCNSELIKSTQNSLYHILHDVTSFILFPF